MSTNVKPEARIEVPACWKCKSGKFTRESDGRDKFVGCAAHKYIRDFADAEERCPILPKNRKLRHYAVAFISRHNASGKVVACFNSKHGYQDREVVNATEALGDDSMRTGCLVEYTTGTQDCRFINTGDIKSITV
jgi:hypothetical protein